MASNKTLTDKQINDLLTRYNYKYRDQTKRDLQSALSYFKDLNLIPEKYNYPDGSVKDLISLSGTIPVTYNNARYNIPVQLYLADTHPYLAPVCYVRPTPEMNINVSNTVNSNGRISLPYLSDWKPPPHSDLYTLLNIMVMKFNEETPLYSKGRSTNASSQYQPQPQPAASNPLPYPSDSRPVYPMQTQNPPYPISNMTPYPANLNSQPAPYPTSMNTQSTPYPITNNPYYPMPSNLNQVQPPLSYMRSGSNSNLGQVRTTNPGQSQSYADETIRPEFYKMSLITAVQDKVRKKYAEMDFILVGETEHLNRMKQGLEKGQLKLNQLISDAESEAINLSELTAELKRKTNQLNESINRIQHRDKANIEDAIVTPAPLYRQLMQLYAEELAIQDLIYYLSEGLQRNTISLEVFLKQARFLSRRQFMLRATMQKAREKAALPL